MGTVSRPSLFFNFLLVLCRFHIMHCESTHRPIPLLLPSALATFPLPEQNKTKNNKNLSMEAVVWSSESHSIPFNSYIFTCKYSLHWVIDLVWGPWLLELYWYWVLIGIPLGYSVIILCQEAPVALDLQGPFHMLQQFMDEVDIRVGWLLALALDLGGK